MDSEEQAELTEVRDIVHRWFDQVFWTCAQEYQKTVSKEHEKLCAWLTASSREEG